MARPSTTIAPASRSAWLAEAHDLRSGIAAALATDPVDEHALHRAVWSYVVGARQGGTSPGYVVMTLGRLVESARITSGSARQAVTSLVTRWCVEAYLGRLDGEVMAADRDALSEARAVQAAAGA